MDSVLRVPHADRTLQMKRHSDLCLVRNVPSLSSPGGANDGWLERKAPAPTTHSARPETQGPYKALACGKWCFIESQLERKFFSFNESQ